MDCLFLFNLIAAVLHFIQAIAVHAVAPAVGPPQTFGGRQFDVFKPVFTYENELLVTTLEKSGTVDVVDIIIGFFLLSAVFQSVSACVGWRWLRFIEYSFSASAMLLAIAVESGVRSIHTLRCMVALMWATQMLGLIAEKAGELRLVVVDSDGLTEWYWVLPHAVAWVTCAAAYAPALFTFIDNQDKAPDFVKWLVYLELILFMSFGLVQLYGLVAKSLTSRFGAECDSRQDLERKFYLMPKIDKYMAAIDRIDDTCEFAYIALSLVAKTLLGWIILSPVVFAK
jgi:hypothetical protein